MGKNSKNNDINFKTIFTFLKSDKGKKISFVVFYFFFFVFLFIFFNTNKIATNTQKVESSLPFITSNLENNNYKFKYIVKSNYNELLYQVYKTNNYININDDTGEYKLVYKNGKLEDNSNIVIVHKELLDIYEIKRIIKNSKFISITKLNETNEYMYNYTITNNNLNKILNNTITNQILENEIIVKTSSKKEILKIEFNLINYEKELNSNLESFKITIEIGDYNE